MSVVSVMGRRNTPQRVRAERTREVKCSWMASISRRAICTVMASSAWSAATVASRNPAGSADGPADTTCRSSRREHRERWTRYPAVPSRWWRQRRREGSDWAAESATMDPGAAPGGGGRGSVTLRHARRTAAAAAVTLGAWRRRVSPSPASAATASSLCCGSPGPGGSCCGQSSPW